MIDNKMLEEKKSNDKPVTSRDIDSLCRDLAGKTADLHEMLEKHPNIDADVLKRVQGIYDYLQTILPINNHLRKKRAEKRKKMVGEDVSVSAKSSSATQQVAKKLAGDTSNVIVTETKIVRLKDVLSESVLNGFKKKITK